MLALSLGWCRSAPAQDGADPEIELLDRKVKQFFEAVSLDDVEAAFQQLLAGSQLAKQKEAVKALVDKTRELRLKYGESRGVERVAARRVGKDLVLLKYLYKCEQFPVVWSLTFYRTAARGDILSEPANTWKIVLVRFDTDLEALGR
ncbi:MAG: hypothetical protein ACUVUC_01070 [Thermoguttaceae bacterium]